MRGRQFQIQLLDTRTLLENMEQAGSSSMSICSYMQVQRLNIRELFHVFHRVWQVFNILCVRMKSTQKQGIASVWKVSQETTHFEVSSPWIFIQKLIFACLIEPYTSSILQTELWISCLAKIYFDRLRIQCAQEMLRGHEQRKRRQFFMLIFTYHSHHHLHNSVNTPKCCIEQTIQMTSLT